jgi:shikimate dehydrogenase
VIKTLVIGDPIAHSLSPVMHNEAFKHSGIKGCYEKKRVTADELSSFVTQLKNSDYTGCNVTIPHKVAVIPLLDEVDQEAIEIGAVNTIVNNNGKLIGYNTDGPGFLQGLKQKIERPIEENRILVVGAGGAARAISYVLLNESPIRLSIANRSDERLRQLINVLNRDNIEALTIKKAESKLLEFDIIINTTNAGMHPDIHSIPLELDDLKDGTVVCDIVYNPLQTKWLQIAKRKGALTDNGLSMLVMQGALAFEKWTGTFPDAEKMRRAVEKELRR